MTPVAAAVARTFLAGGVDAAPVLYDNLKPYLVNLAYEDQGVVGISVLDKMVFTFNEPMNAGILVDGTDFLVNGTTGAAGSTGSKA